MIKTLLNPFEKFSTKKLAFFGIVITLVGSYFGYLFQGRFDGVIDLHFTNDVSILQPFLDNVINVFSIFIFLFLFGKIINKKTRAVDIFNTSIVARIPFYILPFSNINNFMINFTNEIMGNVDLKNPVNLKIETFDLVGILVFAFLSIGLLIVFVILLFNGFKTATNCKKINHTLLFVVSIIFGEILSKGLIYFINY